MRFARLWLGANLVLAGVAFAHVADAQPELVRNQAQRIAELEQQNQALHAQIQVMYEGPR